MIVTGIGYRIVLNKPEKEARLLDLASAALNDFEPELVISSYQQGWDRMLAKAAVMQGIPVQIAIPYEGHDSTWPEDVLEDYIEMLSLATSVEYVSPPGYDPEKYLINDEWKIDHTGLILALCGREAEQQHALLDIAEQDGKMVINLWNTWNTKYK